MEENNHFPMGQIQKFIKNFIASESFGGIFLFISMILALLVSNSPWEKEYTAFWELKLGISFHQNFIGLTLKDWINDVLMSFFFLMVGLEIKREFLIGELANPKNALFPIFAAIGGMIIPGLIYYVLNFHTPSSHGFGIPMATDIAFSLGVILLLGKKVPFSLKVFLVTLAVVDDLGAILVIGIFYTQQIHWDFLILAGGVILFLMVLNYLGVCYLWAYLIVGILLWILTYKSGVHVTISAVILAFCIPLRFEKKSSKIGNFLAKARQKISQNIQRSTFSQSPLKKLESLLHPYCIYLIMPLFSFANAGINFSQDINFGIDHVFLGIFLGLFLGKPIGIFCITFLCDRLGIAKKPSSFSWGHLFGVGVLAGIGFTMSIFVTNLAFDHSETKEAAKATILIASFLAAICGILVLFLINKISK